MTSRTEDNKLSVVLHVEAGCLGPNGADHIAAFCDFSHKAFNKIYADFINWEIYPRNDISQPELKFMLNNKHISPQQVDIYLKLFGKNASVIEKHAYSSLSIFIAKYTKKIITGSHH